MTGIGNTRNDLERLYTALKELADSNRLTEASREQRRVGIPEAGVMHPVPKYKEYVDLQNAAGRICAYSIIPYPPGVPFVCPGEEISRETCSYIKKLRDDGEKVIGVNDKGQVLVGKE